MKTKAFMKPNQIQNSIFKKMFLFIFFKKELTSSAVFKEKGNPCLT